ncbi:hypothetical protein OIE66_32285 [Nonomuraea sp. NBC_01738]|uniref:hypothetical protein n=1 Tax=Nonomuraea sp. NBC_01738 TaxID=2976003 RepID=UPI002E164DF2|nr:hypothetical protein OIE66_32285 [Nonomuraea sp. NBC_01738]
MKLEDLIKQYGRDWEFLSDITQGIAAARWRCPSEEHFKLGMLPVLLTPNADALIPHLEDQAKFASWSCDRTAPVGGPRILASVRVCGSGLPAHKIPDPYRSSNDKGVAR